MYITKTSKRYRVSIAIRLIARHPGTTQKVDSCVYSQMFYAQPAAIISHAQRSVEVPVVACNTETALAAQLFTFHESVQALAALSHPDILRFTTFNHKPCCIIVQSKLFAAHASTDCQPGSVAGVSAVMSNFCTPPTTVAASADR
eukprot:5260735-Pleurochrysis_carterae.AAC.2